MRALHAGTVTQPLFKAREISSRVRDRIVPGRPLSSRLNFPFGRQFALVIFGLELGRLIPDIRNRGGELGERLLDVAKQGGELRGRVPDVPKQGGELRDASWDVAKADGNFPALPRDVATGGEGRVVVGCDVIERPALVPAPEPGDA